MSNIMHNSQFYCYLGCPLTKIQPKPLWKCPKFFFVVILVPFSMSNGMVSVHILLNHNMKNTCLLKVEYLLNRSTDLNVRTRVFTPCAHAHARIFTKINLVVSTYLISLSFKFRKDPCIRWGDIQLLVTMYILYYTLNYSQFSTENLIFLGHLLTDIF